MDVASLVSGPLSSTSASLAKVATCPKSETPNYQHLLCIYLPNVYDKAAVIEVRASLGSVNFGLSDTYMGQRSCVFSSAITV